MSPFGQFREICEIACPTGVFIIVMLGNALGNASRNLNVFFFFFEKNYAI